MKQPEAPTRQYNVLVAYDGAQSRQFLSDALRLAGYGVWTASDTAAALYAVKLNKPDLIVACGRRESCDGYELARQVHALDETRFVPVLIRPDAGGEGELDFRAEAGPLVYAHDAADVESLLARARTLLEFKTYLDSCDEAVHIDALTGLPNRRRFDRRLEQEISRTQRNGRPFCLVTFDIDHFKHVNDTYGHPCGDEVLRQMARAAAAETRTNVDLLARVGGEEFALLLPETNFVAGAEVAERLRARVAGMRVPQVGRITASFGVSEFPLCAPTPDELLAAADQALYTAKRTGRNRVVVAGQQKSCAA
jgi:diguanylate cyclase (GGDEF)-like protein